jgi:hypothetical protein
MTISYDIATQLVTLTITPAEINEMNGDTQEAVKAFVAEIVAKIKERLAG